LETNGIDDIPPHTLLDQFPKILFQTTLIQSADLVAKGSSPIADLQYLLATKLHSGK
jgi:hypothetical protein